MTTAFAPQELIRVKRDGGALSEHDIRRFIAAYTAGLVSDEVTAELLMAIYQHGLDNCELAAWTHAMVYSGPVADLTSLGRGVVDKHSTGGIGDKVSLVLVPLVAACGAKVPQVAGRGLGLSGGTIDKLESIPGWRARLDAADVRKALAHHGCVITDAGPDLAPADRRMYALRDVTCTVESIALIASSIMSKKIAAGATRIVFDVKCGTGAFMTEQEDAQHLATTLIDLGQRYGVHSRALITDMNALIGRTIGNALEVGEAIETLRGGGPADLIELAVALATEILDMAEIASDPGDVLASGDAFEVWQAMIAAQGGDLTRPLPVARHVETVKAETDGYFRGIDAYEAGLAAWRSGARRASQSDAISPGAGLRVLVDIGSRVSVGQPLIEIHADDTERLEWSIATLDTAELVGQERQFGPVSRVLERIKS